MLPSQGNSGTWEPQVSQGKHEENHKESRVSQCKHKGNPIETSRFLPLLVCLFVFNQFSGLKWIQSIAFHAWCMSIIPPIISLSPHFFMHMSILFKYLSLSLSHLYFLIYLCVTNNTYLTYISLTHTLSHIHCTNMHVCK